MRQYLSGGHGVGLADVDRAAQNDAAGYESREILWILVVPGILRIQVDCKGCKSQACGQSCGNDHRNGSIHVFGASNAIRGMAAEW